jgi:hypothetical protein
MIETMGIPDDEKTFFEDWLTDEINYVKANGSKSALHSSNHGTLQDSVSGPVQFSLCSIPLYELDEQTTYTGGNHNGEENGNLKVALDKVKAKTEKKL